MVFEIEIDAEPLIKTLDNLAEEPLDEPVQNRARWKRVMREGTQQHFDRLAPGDRTDSTALGGSVTWPSARAEITKKTRLRMGEPPGPPYLNASGDMKRAFTAGASMQVTKSSQHVSIRYYTANPLENRKAFKHQTGGSHDAFFAPFNLQMDNFPFPQRQFLYWDEAMEDDVLNFLIDSIQRSVQGV